MSWDPPKYRKLGLNDTVSIELPAAVWLQFVSAYVSADWSCGAANIISHQVSNELLDPIYLKERLAADAAEAAKQAAEMHSMFGFPPPGGIPPTPEGLQ